MFQGGCTVTLPVIFHAVMLLAMLSPRRQYAPTKPTEMDICCLQK